MNRKVAAEKEEAS